MLVGDFVAVARHSHIGLICATGSKCPLPQDSSDRQKREVQPVQVNRTARRVGVTRTVCENVSGLWVESDLRALDDMRTCLTLLIA